MRNSKLNPKEQLAKFIKANPIYAHIHLSHGLNSDVLIKDIMATLATNIATMVSGEVEFRI